jgi:hypothetical protein
MTTPATTSPRKPAGKVRTGDPRADRAVRATGQRESIAVNLEGEPDEGKPAKPARQARTTKRAPKPRVTKTVPAPKATKPTSNSKPEQAEPQEKSARDYQREIARQLIVVGGDLVAQQVPPKLRAEVGQAVANMIHHLTNQKAGWPGKLPKPKRSDWM